MRTSLRIVVFVGVICSVMAVHTPAQDLATLQDRAKSGRPADLVEYAKALLKAPDAASRVQEAVGLLQKAGEAGNTEGWLQLGRLYADGKLVRQDYAKAFSLCLRAAKLGDPRGMVAVGSFYQRGWGVAPDKAEGRRWIQQAADLGNETAIEWLRTHPADAPVKPMAGPKEPAATRESPKPPPSKAVPAAPVPPMPQDAGSPAASAGMPATLSGLMTAEALAGGRIGGDVLATQALMRVLAGPIPTEQEAQFQAPYAAAGSLPTEKVAARHRQLNRSLIDAIVERELLLQSIREYDAAMLEARIAEFLGDASGRQEALEIAGVQNQIIQAAAKRLEALAQKAEAASQAEGSDVKPASLSGDPAYLANLRILWSTAIPEPEMDNRKLFGTWVFEETRIEPIREAPGSSQRVLLENTGGSMERERIGRATYNGIEWDPGPDSRVDIKKRVKANFRWSMPPDELPLFFTPGTEPQWGFDSTITMDLSQSRIETSLREYGDQFAEYVTVSMHTYWREHELYSYSFDSVGTTFRNGPAQAKFEEECRLNNIPPGDNSGKMTRTIRIVPLSPSEYPVRDGKVPILAEERLRIVFATPAGIVAFIYRWMPGSGAVRKTNAPSDITIPSNLDEEKKTAVEEHLVNIRYAEQAIEGFRRDLQGAADPDAADRLRFSILHLEQDIHEARDLIESIRAGRIVRTRGPWEKHAEAVAIQTLRRVFDTIARAQQLQASALRLAAVLRQYAPHEAKKAHELILRQISTGVFDEGGLARAQGALDQIYGVTRASCEQAQGERLGDQQKAVAGLERIDTTLGYVEALKQNADRAIFAGTLFTPAGPGAAIFLAYEGATVSAEKGPVEGIKQVALDASVMAALAGTMKVGQCILNKFLNPKIAPTADEVFQAAKYQQELQFNQGLVSRVKETQAALDRARRGGASAQDLAALEAAAGDAVSAANSSTLAKRILKNDMHQAQEALQVAEKQARLTAGNPDALRVVEKTRAEAAARLREIESLNSRFQGSLNQIYSKVDDATVADMRAGGYNIDRSWFKEFRNATSRGINGDRDFGILLEKEGLICKDGRHVDLYTFMSDCQAAYERNYKKFNNGRSARLADQNITTTAHPESFPLEYLDSAKVGTASPELARKAGQTVLNKVNSALAGSDPELVKLQKAYASLSKDLKSKVFTRIEATRPRGSLTADKLEKAKAYWSDIAHVMDDFAKGRTDPITATQQMRLLTGGKTVAQVAADVRNLMVKLAN